MHRCLIVECLMAASAPPTGFKPRAADSTAEDVSNCQKHTGSVKIDLQGQNTSICLIHHTYRSREESWSGAEPEFTKISFYFTGPIFLRSFPGSFLSTKSQMQFGTKRNERVIQNQHIMFEINTKYL